jgi:hypothetical protein
MYLILTDYLPDQHSVPVRLKAVLLLLLVAMHLGFILQRCTLAVLTPKCPALVVLYVRRIPIVCTPYASCSISGRTGSHVQPCFQFGAFYVIKCISVQCLFVCIKRSSA